MACGAVSACVEEMRIYEVRELFVYHFGSSYTVFRYAVVHVVSPGHSDKLYVGQK